VKRIIEEINSNPNESYFLIFVACELLQLVSIACLFTLAVIKLDLTSFEDVLRLPLNFLIHENVRTDRQILIFPRKVAFFIQVYGTSGEEQMVDALCIVGNQLYIEITHILLFFFISLMLAISILNFFYVLGNIHFIKYAKFGVAKTSLNGNFLSYNQKLTLCLMYHNVPSKVYVDVVTEMFRKGAKDKLVATKRQTTNVITSPFFPYQPIENKKKPQKQH
jgi:Innexin